LDESDNDPARFLAYLIAALQQVHATIGATTLSMLQSPEKPPQDLVMTTLVNEIAAVPIDFVLSIDDYHLIRTPEIHRMLSFLVEHLPTNMHLVLLTREDPPLPLPRLRTSGQMVEIRQADLRFSVRECQDFLQRVMNLSVEPADVAALERRTEGWVSGLLLAGMSMQGRDDLHQFIRQFTGSNRYVLDYLMDEVFNRQAPEVQDFLLKTAILEQLCAPLCDAVVGRSGSQAILKSMEHANLFLHPLDQRRHWYRYHRLFGELLRNRLRGSDDLCILTLHRRACRWLMDAGLQMEAIPHALGAGDWECVAELLQSVSSLLLKRGEIVQLVAWFSQVPDSVLQAHPGLYLESSWPLILSGQFQQAASLLAQAETCAQDSHEFLGRVLTAKAYLARLQGDPERMVTLAQQAKTLLPKEDAESRCIVATSLGVAYWHMGRMPSAESALSEALQTARLTGNEYAALTARVFQGMVWAVQGQLRRAASAFELAVREPATTFIHGLATLYLSVLHYEWNHLDVSSRYLLETVALGERIHNDELLVSSWILLAQLHLASGHPAAAWDALESAQQRLRSGNVPSPAAQRLAAARVQMCLAQGDLSVAVQIGSQMAAGVDSHSFYRFINLTRVKLLLAQNQQAQARTLLKSYSEQASEAGWRYGLVAIRGYQTLAAASLAEGLEYLKDGLTMAQPEGFLRTFVDLGEGLQPYLEEVSRGDGCRRYAADILAAMAQKPAPSLIAQIQLVEPLSQRELEVLDLLVEGCTNPQIAERLVISVGTVKTHVHHICGKLGVSNRRKAVARARELGLL
jgi:LuxR family maltose regulon positive regulatory protein